MMNIKLGMGAMGAIGTLSILGSLIGLVKEVLIIILLFKGIKVADIYINKNNNSINKDQ